jgi:hypothetical protein
MKAVDLFLTAFAYFLQFFFSFYFLYSQINSRTKGTGKSAQYIKTFKVELLDDGKYNHQYVIQR